MEPREFGQRWVFFGEGIRACLAIVLFGGGTTRGLAFEVCCDAQKSAQEVDVSLKFIALLSYWVCSQDRV